ncbi:MAG: hypothetical protein ACRDFS_09295 [Chloroflexota bacterium]
MAEQEVAYNPTSCQMRMQRETLTSSGPGAASPNVLCCGGGGGYDAHAFAKYTDPGGYTVTPSYAYIKWYTGSCIHDQSSSEDPYYLWQTGWYVQRDWSPTETSCNEYVKDSYNDFANDTFCPGATEIDPTFTHYDPNAIEGFNDGSYQQYLQPTLGGPCSFALSLYHDSMYGP